MLLIMCQCGANRYAIDSRHVREVLPRVRLQRLSGSPPWLAGMLICRGTAVPVMDLGQLAGGVACADRLSSRIVLAQVQLGGAVRQFGILAESVGLRETDGTSAPADGATATPAALGAVCLDEQGIFQLVDVASLVTEDRQSFLFPAAGRER
jgi:chemotaxis-related protein WspB